MYEKVLKLPHANEDLVLDKGPRDVDVACVWLQEPVENTNPFAIGRNR